MADKRKIIFQIWSQHLQDTLVSDRMLVSEIEWLKDQFEMTEEEYVAVNRRGRGFSLNRDQRRKVFLALQEYENVLQQMGAVDWCDIPRQMWNYLNDGKHHIPVYDIIMVDEAQFFAPIWIAILRKILTGNNPHLFVVADPTQGFLGRGASWKSLGIDARGRTHLLKHSYRTTREILQFAHLFYRTRVPSEVDEDILSPDFVHMPSGILPQAIVVQSSQDEIARVANEVADFIKNGYPKQHIMVLHSNWHGVKTIINSINHKLGKNTAMNPKDTYPGDYVRVTTLNAGAGLESPIVFLVGLRELFEEEQSQRLSDEERENLIRDNTRKIYMAATRAGQRLVFTFVGELPIDLQRVFGAIKP